MDKKLIAVCGMNCGLCFYHLKPEGKCPGCFAGRNVNGRCLKCAIKLCKKRKGEYCFECDEFPCDRLKRMDKRYQERYGMSEIENLKTIKEKGIIALVAQERKKWINKEGVFCVHDKKRYKG
ncbi:MAG: DUF3795 domain-containing protein [Bacteroidetes bacterium]|nr:DUF3795 domain-containing protein [Bacteroidota bacterium]